MKTRLKALVTGSVMLVSLVFLSGCASTDEGGSSQVSAGMYYGTSFYDPWYYGGAYYPPDVIVTPPPNRPAEPPHVEQPIAPPPTASPPVARPMPSIPSMPRPAFRR